MSGIDPELLNDPIFVEFRAEAADLLDRARNVIDAWTPGRPDDQELAEVLRHLHTIKGNAAMFGLDNTSRTAHELESFLVEARNERRALALDEIERLQAGTDAIESMIASGDQPAPAVPADAEVPSPPRDVSAEQPPRAEQPTPSSKPRRRADDADELIRVPLRRVNAALNHTWEMFLLRNQLSYLVERHHAASDDANYEFLQTWEVIDSAMRRNIADLESVAMGMRMRTVRIVYDRVERTARSYLAAHDKQVQIVRHGEHIEVDKQVVDLLSEPIVHLIRNALDHGIEDTETRIAAGKPAAGTIELNTELDGDHVALIISDDGRGIDVERVVAKARSLGIDVDGLQTKEERLGLIFNSGLSTVDKVTDVSGRGVGTDAVRSAVAEMGGDVRVTSELGVGTTFVIRLPLRMSVINALLFTVNGGRYAASVSKVTEVCRVTESDLHGLDQEIFFEFRGDFIPVFDTRPLLSGAPVHEDDVSLVIIAHAHRFIALRVSHLQQHVELVLKPLPPLAHSQRPISGYSILHTGEPVFVLDLEALTEMAAQRDSSLREVCHAG